ncbi:hypothetical protein Back11_45650 [Paenibacillus baekrokdamisoli]|uniref:Uncharacterized protein n=1 Tax=Paenibacillus baekrokdamisoli TaxID=1712516 RepID=A0A3G9IWJ3_9BACL|nr:hypothetical protein Back11_45650 [Paenibacillus baekrokdamisoli]
MRGASTEFSKSSATNVLLIELLKLLNSEADTGATKLDNIIIVAKINEKYDFRRVDGTLASPLKYKINNILEKIPHLSI